MSGTAPESSAAGEQAAGAEYLRKAFRTMLLSRATEDKLASLYRSGSIKGGVFLGKGQEALSVALGAALGPGDLYGPIIRDQAGRLAFGDTVADTLRTYLGSAQGPMRGRDGNIHRGRPRDGYYAMISHLGSMVAVIAGGLYAKRLRGEHGMVGGTCLGDGGTSTGAFHEGLNMAAVEKLPLVLVVANNQYAYSTPNDRQFACKDLLDRAVGYGVRGWSVDGTDFLACMDVVGQAVAAAREGGGPQLVLGRLLRLVGHGEHDDASYVDPMLRTAPVGRDCITVAREQLTAGAHASAAEIEAWTSAAAKEVEAALSVVQRERGPDPSEEVWEAIASRHLVDGFAES